MPWRQWTTSCRKSWADMIPNDPVILLSFVNARLRDEYGSLEELCAALDADEADLRRTLASLDYHYDPAYHQFI